MALTLNYQPREYFKRLHSRSKRFTFVLAHRRAGKSYALAADMINRALRTKKQNAQFAYCAPTYTQAETIIWKALHTILGAEILAACKVNRAKLSIVLPNGSEIRVFGLSTPDSLRGFFLDGIVIDEAQDIPAELVNTVIFPALADRQGWMVVSGTPKGTGNSFYRMYKKAKENPNSWELIELPVSTTKVLSEAELEVQRQALSEEDYAQEYELSFQSGNRGSILSKYVNEAELSGRIIDFNHNPSVEVRTVWDLGRDMCVVWMWQYINGEVHIVDMLEWVGSDVSECVYNLKRHSNHFGYKIKKAYLPHDAYDRNFVNGKTIQEVFWGLGFETFKVPEVSRQAGIDAARRLIKAPTTVIHNTRCSLGIEALKSYQYKWDEKAQCFSREPIHNWASHPSDAFRYLALSVNEHEQSSSIVKADKHVQSGLPIARPGVVITNDMYSPQELAWLGLGTAVDDGMSDSWY